MSEPKPFASLSSGLLARKGAAKPAMRPQGFGNIGGGMEDLGWNDMGQSYPAPAPAFPVYEEPLPEHVPSSIAALTPAPKPQSAETEAGEEENNAPEPVVVEQQRKIAERLADDSRSTPSKAEKPNIRAVAPVVPLPAGKRQEAGRKGKAAFTLRLDADRHLKLRLACAVTNRSAQMLLTEVLDEMLKSIPEIEALAGSLPAKTAKRS